MPIRAGDAGRAQRDPAARAAAVATYFEFLELRHKVEIHAVTGMVVACPLDEMNRPRGSKEARLRIPPREAEMQVLFAGWAGDLARAASSRPRRATTRRPG